MKAKHRAFFCSIWLRNLIASALFPNHFKSQSGGGGAKRKRQAKAVRKIVNELVQGGAHVVVLGDLNEGPAVADTQAPNLAMLFENNSPLIDCYSLPGLISATVPEHSTPASCGTDSTTSLFRRACSLITERDVFLEKDCGAAAQNVLLSGRHIPR